jgi:hypothetical protein
MDGSTVWEPSRLKTFFDVKNKQLNDSGHEYSLVTNASNLPMIKSMASDGQNTFWKYFENRK